MDAARIARLFALQPALMAQRLVRASVGSVIRGSPLRVRRPRTDLPGRLPAVVESIYGAYAIDRLDQYECVRESIPDDARWLAALTAGLLITEPEAWGLAALLTLAQARAPARTGTPWPPSRPRADRHARSRNSCPALPWAGCHRSHRWHSTGSGSTCDTIVNGSCVVGSIVVTS